MTKNGSDIVDLLKQRQSELKDELDRVTIALKALGASTTRASSSPAAAASKPPKKPGRPAASIGGKTVLDRIEAAIASAGRPLRVKEIAKLVGAPYSTLAATLRRGRSQKRLLNPSFGAWTLPRLAGATTTTAGPKKRGKYKPRKKKAAGTKAPKKTAKKRGRKKAAAVVVVPVSAPPASPAT